MAAQDLDVNVHPTKKEVHFLYEDKLLELLHAELSSALRSSNDSRSFQVQTTLRFDLPVQTTALMLQQTGGADDNSVFPPRNLSYLTAKLLPADTSQSVSSGQAGAASSTSVATTSARSSAPSSLPATSASTREAPQTAAGSTGPLTDYKAYAEEEDAEFDFSQVHNRHYLAPRATSSSTALSNHAQAASTVAQSDDKYDMDGDSYDSDEEDYDQEEDMTEDSDGESQEGRGDKSAVNGDEEEIIFKSSTSTQRGSALYKSKGVSGGSSNGVRPAAPIAPKKMVRTDPNLVKIDAFFKPAPTVPPFAPGSSFRGPSDSSLVTSSAAVREDNCECAVPSLPEPAPDASNDPEEVYCVPTGSSVGLPVGSKRAAGMVSDLPGGFAGSCLCCGKAPKRSKPSSKVPPPMPVCCKLDELVETSCEYVSVQALIREIKSGCSGELEAMLRNHTYVGAVDCYFSLIQHGTRLILLDHSHLLKDMYYQIALRRFAELDKWVLEQPVSLAAYLEAALGAEHAAGRLDVPHSEVPALTTAAVALLCSKAPLVHEYFNISIDAERETLTALPILVPGVKPLLQELPTFLLNLATHTNWDDETACFQTVALNLASYYSILDTEDVPVDVTAAAPGPAPFPQLAKESTDLLGNVLYPAMRLYLLPHRQRSTDHTVIQVAALEQLYKVFERC